MCKGMYTESKCSQHKPTLDIPSNAYKQIKTTFFIRAPTSHILWYRNLFSTDDHD